MRARISLLPVWMIGGGNLWWEIPWAVSLYVTLSCGYASFFNLLETVIGSIPVQVVNLKNGSVMKQLDPHGAQITGLVYCMRERAVLSAAWDGQVRQSGCSE